MYERKENLQLESYLLNSKLEKRCPLDHGAIKLVSENIKLYCWMDNYLAELLQYHATSFAK